MIVSGGYPGDYSKGKIISGLEKVNGSLVFHAGTATADNEVVSSGGRVIAVTSLAVDINSAVDQSLKSVGLINRVCNWVKSG